MQYIAVTARDGPQTTIEFPDLEGCATFAEAGEEVTAVAREALESWLEAKLIDGHAPPRPSYDQRPKGATLVPVAVSSQLGARLQIRWARDAAGISQGELQQVFFEFHSLFNHAEPNDRAIAIVGAAFLDRLLGEILANYFVDNDKESEKLLAPDGPLGPFGTRITTCYCLGLIGKTVTSDLRLVAKIRNRFAHEIRIDFADQRVESWCRALAWHRFSMGAMGEPPANATTRDLFQVGVNQLVTYLNGLPAVARLDRRRTCEDGVA